MNLCIEELSRNTMPFLSQISISLQRIYQGVCLERDASQIKIPYLFSKNSMSLNNNTSSKVDVQSILHIYSIYILI